MQDRMIACRNHPMVFNASHPYESFPETQDLLLVIVTGIVTTVLVGGGLSLLPPHAAGAATAKGRGQGKVDVLLGVEADHEGRDVDDLLADAVMMVSTWVQCARSLRILTGCGAGG